MKPEELARETAVFEVQDNSEARIPGTSLIKGDQPRDTHGLSARLAQQLLQQNRGLLRDFNVHGDVKYDGSKVEVVLQAGEYVGALPLVSPTSGRPDYGLIIRPRFGWQGIGPMMGAMGWKVVPAPLPLPLLPRSDRKIPPWVLSTTILSRMQALLSVLERNFQMTEDELVAPRGSIHWERYARVKVPRADFLRVPCRFPNLTDDYELKAAIHYTLHKQFSSLQSQRTTGIIVIQLLEWCRGLLERVRDVPPRPPHQTTKNRWLQENLRSDVFRKGVQAVEWTMEDRGLAGLSDLQGLPWILRMDQFFEAWVETIVNKLAASTGGLLRSGRKRETLLPLSWEPPYSGSQRYLLPDLVMERESETVIFDAKYKSHLEELNREGWSGLEEDFRVQHRSDLLQVLAYSSVFEGKNVTCCLAYPCHSGTWHSLLQRGRPFHRASLRAGNRNIQLVLTAVPMGIDAHEIVPVLQDAVVN